MVSTMSVQIVKKEIISVSIHPRLQKINKHYCLPVSSIPLSEQELDEYDAYGLQVLLRSVFDTFNPLQDYFLINRREDVFGMCEIR